MKREALHYLEPIETASRSVAVLEAMAEMIERAGLQVGDRLPPEVAIAAALGVGRSTIREALNRWEGLGLIRRRRGDGTYLTAKVSTAHGPLPLIVQMEGEALLRLLDMRRVIESGTVRRAATKATLVQRQKISRLCDHLLELVASGKPYRAADMAFHAAICDATGNPMFGQLLQRMDEAFERSEESPFTVPWFGLTSFPSHRTLADAILAGDPDTAEAALKTILDRTEAEIRDIIADGPPLAR
jgi:GntR family transcriptional repressor for pyruvate dehydrogenase complex